MEIVRLGVIKFFDISKIKAGAKCCEPVDRPPVAQPCGHSLWEIWLKWRCNSDVIRSLNTLLFVIILAKLLKLLSLAI